MTPKGAGSRGASPLAAIRIQLALAALTTLGIAYQVSAQLAGLPGALTPFACGVSVLWAIVSGGFLTATVLWATSVRHRRETHRFPVQLEVRFATVAPEPTLGRASGTT